MPGRVILHLDLDCFYAQVEQIRSGIPEEEPTAAHQWGFILAVNYIARKSGVKRGDNINEAKRKCPAIHLLHVETLGDNRKPGEPYDRTHQKATLRRYRLASADIFKILFEFAPLCERASIDEAYLDVSLQVQQRLAKLSSMSSDFCAQEANKDTRVIGVDAVVSKAVTEEHLEETTESIAVAFPVTPEEQELCIGAQIAREIRQAVRDRLGYTCSVGISTSKLLAKLASPLNKPSGQTLVAPRFVPVLMHAFPLRKIKGLGGKLGKILEELYHERKQNLQSSQPLQQQESPKEEEQAKAPDLTVGAFLAVCDHSSLEQRLGTEKAQYVEQLCAGQREENSPEEQFETRLSIKSFASTKQFAANEYLTRPSQLEYWLEILSREMLLRCEEEMDATKRFPRDLRIHWVVTAPGASSQSRNKKVLVAPNIAVEQLKSKLVVAMMPQRRTKGTAQENETVGESDANVFPCSSLTLVAKEFVALSTCGGGISGFLVKKALSEPENAMDDELAASDTRKRMLRELDIDNRPQKRTTIARLFEIQQNVQLQQLQDDRHPEEFTSHDALKEDRSASTDSTTGVTRQQEDGDEEVDTISMISSFLCEKCASAVEYSLDKQSERQARQEHQDFHFAQQLYSEQKQQQQQETALFNQTNASTKFGPMDAFLGRRNTISGKP